MDETFWKHFGNILGMNQKKIFHSESKSRSKRIRSVEYHLSVSASILHPLVSRNQSGIFCIPSVFLVVPKVRGRRAM